jgi:hypothetical protein
MMVLSRVGGNTNKKDQGRKGGVNTNLRVVYTNPLRRVEVVRFESWSWIDKGFM